VWVSTRALLITENSRAPSAVPVIVPIPPNRLVPPMITAARTWNVNAVPPEPGSAVLTRAAKRIPPSAATEALVT